MKCKLLVVNFIMLSSFVAFCPNSAFLPPPVAFCPNGILSGHPESQKQIRLPAPISTTTATTTIKTILLPLSLCPDLCILAETC